MPKPYTPLRLIDILKAEQNSFGVLRLAMALCVLVSHGFYLATGQVAAEPLVALTGHSLGEHAVQVFFFLSGVLVSQSLVRSGSVIDFGTGRALRIFPGLLVCVALTAGVLGPFMSTHSLMGYVQDPELGWYVVKTALLITASAPLPGVFETAPAQGLVNMSLWTLKFEVLCYIILGTAGALGLLKVRNRWAVGLGLAAGLCVICLRSPVQSSDFTGFENIRYFALYFGSGVLACLLKRHVVISFTWTVVFFAAYMALIGTPLCELSCAAFQGSAALYAASFRFGSLRSVCNRHDLSYGTYIYGAPVQQSMLHMMPALSPMMLSAAALPVVLTLAALSWLLVERPAMGSRRSATRAVTVAVDALVLRRRLARSSISS